MTPQPLTVVTHLMLMRSARRGLRQGAADPHSRPASPEYKPTSPGYSHWTPHRGTPEGSASGADSPQYDPTSPRYSPRESEVDRQEGSASRADSPQYEVTSPSYSPRGAANGSAATPSSTAGRQPSAGGDAQERADSPSETVFFDTQAQDGANAERASASASDSASAQQQQQGAGSAAANSPSGAGAVNSPSRTGGARPQTARGNRTVKRKDGDSDFCFARHPAAAQAAAAEGSVQTGTQDPGIEMPAGSSHEEPAVGMCNEASGQGSVETVTTPTVRGASAHAQGQSDVAETAETASGLVDIAPTPRPGKDAASGSDASCAGADAASSAASMLSHDSAKSAEGVATSVSHTQGAGLKSSAQPSHSPSGPFNWTTPATSSYDTAANGMPSGAGTSSNTSAPGTQPSSPFSPWNWGAARSPGAKTNSPFAHPAAASSDFRSFQAGTHPSGKTNPFTGFGRFQPGNTDGQQPVCSLTRAPPPLLPHLALDLRLQLPWASSQTVPATKHLAWVTSFLGLSSRLSSRKGPKLF